MSSNTGRMILKYTDLSKLGLLLNISCSHFLGHGRPKSHLSRATNVVKVAVTELSD